MLRVLVAGACGMVIGIERTNRSKNAGVRTHCIVALGAALIMIISKYGFSDSTIGEYGMRGADGARIAAQVVSGIGFLGAGMIFVHKSSITGLTTAAGIWATSGIGLAIGAGMYVLGILTTIAIVIIQLLFHKNFRWLRTPALKAIYIEGVDVPNYQTELVEKLGKLGVNVVDTAINKDNAKGTRNYVITIELSDILLEESILDLIDYDCRIENA